MFVKKSTSGLFSPPPNKQRDHSFVAFELKRLVLTSLTVALMLAVISYSPGDPSLSTWSTKSILHNWMGRAGSVTSDLLLQLFGLSAFTITLLPAIFALKLPLREEDTLQTKIVGPLMLIFSTSLLSQAIVQSKWAPWHLTNPGGLLGESALQLFSYLAGRVGAYLLSIVLFFSSLIIIFRWRLTTLASYLANEIKARLKIFAVNCKTLYLPLIFKKLNARILRRKDTVGSLKTKEPSTIAMIEPALNAHSTEPEDSTIKETLNSKDNDLNIPNNQEVIIALPEVANAVVSPQIQRTTVQKVPRHRIHRGRDKDFQLPHLGLISGRAESKVKSADKNWYLEKANILVQKLKDFGVEGEVVHISPGPVITVYEFKPASGVKIKEISNLSDDLTLALSVLSVRIVAPIPGKPVVGIEIPSPYRETVYFKDMIQETPFFSNEMKIPIALGRMASGEPLASDLASMPHLLIAGSTGTGKSVFINTLICSLLYRFSPEQLKLILVDPKMVELSHYEGVPHLLLPVVVDSRKAVLALRWTVEEMERRYTLMHQCGVRHIDAYNERLQTLHKGEKREQEITETPLPYIIVVIDEYADLMAVVPKEVELSVARLAQKARASGIHVVLATQRPSTDVVTGTIKANFPSRISFRVASSVDSKTILDRTGAERLLGYGDLLFHSAGFNTLKRMQGPFLPDSDLSRIVDYLKSQGEPEYDERILGLFEENMLTDGNLSSDDDADGQLYDQAVRIVTERGEASISLIQRHLRIGYNKAAGLMEQMEKEGVVGASTGPAKRRSVLANSLT